MDKTGAGCVFNERVAGEEFASAVAKRMLIFELAEMTPIEAANNFITVPAAFLGDGGEQQRGYDQLFAANMNERIAERRIVSDSKIGWKRPWCRRPYDQGCPGMSDDGKFYVNALADVVVILDFGFGQSRAAGNAPIDGLFAAINESLLDDVGEEP